MLPNVTEENFAKVKEKQGKMSILRKMLRVTAKIREGIRIILVV